MKRFSISYFKKFKMLIKVDLPISERIAEQLLHPVLYLHLTRFIPNYATETEKHEGTRVSYISDSLIVVKKRGVAGLTVHNLYNNQISYIMDRMLLLTNVNTNIPIYRKMDTFQQNDLSIQKRLGKYVNNHLGNVNNTSDIIIGVGGEYYVYFVHNSHIYSKFYGFSNNDEIVKVADANCSLYLPHSTYTNKRIDYGNIHNEINEFRSLIQRGYSGSTHPVIIVNLANLPISVFEMLANEHFKKIIIITCHLQVFNKRRHILEKSPLRLISFRHLRGKTGITVSIFVYQMCGKRIIS